MSSSKRHWPSMFKSKPCNTLHPWHRHRDILNSSLKPPSTPPSGGGSEERSAPEPKARWNPKPEQIRILEAIFNSGMVNPPREEIRNIRAKLQEYGQVGDANVFYWFQNRKSRTKHKKSPPPPQQNPTPPLIPGGPSPSSSSSSSEKSSPNDSANHNRFFHARNELLTEPPPSIHQTSTAFASSDGGAFTQSLCFSTVSDQTTVENSPNLLLTELMGFAAAVPPPSTCGGVTGPAKSTVFINDLAIEVAAAHFNVKAAFGDDAVLIHYSSGQPLLTNEWGLTLDPLQDGAYYYLVRT
nr:WUSCHEL-related homeobox 9-like [Ipomoea batatas]